MFQMVLVNLSAFIYLCERCFMSRKSSQQGLNLRPDPYKESALTTELWEVWLALTTELQAHSGLVFKGASDRT